MNEEMFEKIHKSLEAAKQHKAKRDEWCNQQPNEWRKGDIVIVRGADPLGHGWMLVNQHPKEPKLWYCVLRDDWVSLAGSTDINSLSELGVSGILRCRCSTWIHADDMSIENRIDRDREAAVACSKMISRMYTGWGFDQEECETDSDPDYIEHMSALLQYQNELTEYLHNES